MRCSRNRIKRTQSCILHTAALNERTRASKRAPITHQAHTHQHPTSSYSRFGCVRRVSGLVWSVGFCPFSCCSTADAVVAVQLIDMRCYSDVGRMQSRTTYCSAGLLYTLCPGVVRDRSDRVLVWCRHFKITNTREGHASLAVQQPPQRPNVSPGNPSMPNV